MKGLLFSIFFGYVEKYQSKRLHRTLDSGVGIDVYVHNAPVDCTKTAAAHLYKSIFIDII